MRPALVAMLLLALAACGADPADELEAELHALEQQRVPLAALERARAEADAAESALARLRAAQDEAGQRGAAGTARAAALARELERERAALDADAALGDELRHAIAQARDALPGLDAEIARRREQARALRDQAASLARELRPGDPAWATERRIAVLRELIEKTASAYADDPVIAELAREARAPANDASATAAAQLRAARLRDRIAWVYGLD